MKYAVEVLHGHDDGIPDTWVEMVRDDLDEPAFYHGNKESRTLFDSEFDALMVAALLRATYKKPHGMQSQVHFRVREVIGNGIRK